MSALSGKQIRELVQDKRLVIEPFSVEQVQPASYDLLLGSRLLASPLNAQKLGEAVDLVERAQYDIQPGQMVGVLSLERLELPLDICARPGIRSAFARLGINAFGGIQLDPGFRGRVIMNLLNVGPEPVTLRHKQSLFTIEFQRLEEPAERGYEGPYQDQEDFPADQYNYIIQARTTSLAEIPALRRDMGFLRAAIQDLRDSLADPDEGLEVRPEVIERLLRSCSLNADDLLSPDELRRRLGL